MAGEVRTCGDADYWIGPCCQPRRSPIHAQTQHVLLGRLANGLAESAVEVEGRPSGSGRQRVERDIAGDVSHGAKKLQNPLTGRHLEGYYLRASQRLDVSCAQPRPAQNARASPP